MLTRGGNTITLLLIPVAVLIATVSTNIFNQITQLLLQITWVLLPELLYLNHQRRYAIIRQSELGSLYHIRPT